MAEAAVKVTVTVRACPWIEEGRLAQGERTGGEAQPNAQATRRLGGCSRVGLWWSPNRGEAQPKTASFEQRREASSGQSAQGPARAERQVPSPRWRRQSRETARWWDTSWQGRQSPGADRRRKTKETRKNQSGLGFAWVVDQATTAKDKERAKWKGMEEQTAVC